MTVAPPADDHDLRVASLLVARDGAVRHAHPRLRALLGGDAADFEGRPLRDLLPSPELAAAVREVVDGAPSRAITVRLDAPVRRLHLTLSALTGLGPEPLAMILVASADDCDARAAQRLHGTIEIITAGFAHEVRNPIAAILGLTEAALRAPGVGAAASSMLQCIPELVNRVERTVKKSLRFSRPRLPTRAPHRLAELVASAVGNARPGPGAAALDVRVGDDLDPVAVDAGQFEQVLGSLLQNAHEAARSRVRLSARRAAGARGPCVVLDVEDDGPGIAGEHQPRIFDPFFTTKAENTGLGLAIARELARLNGGDLELHSTSERGTRFSLRLECAAARSARPAHP